LNEEFKALLLETIIELKDHPEGKDGVAFVTEFEEEPEWEVALVFRKIDSTKH